MKDLCFGVDLGGTTAKIGIFKDNGLLIDRWEVPTRTEENGKVYFGRYSRVFE